jgi:hypothetical protein
VSDLEPVVKNPALSFFIATEQYTFYEWLIKGKLCIAVPAYFKLCRNNAASCTSCPVTSIPGFLVQPPT